MGEAADESTWISAQQFHRAPDVTDWRVTAAGPQAVFTAPSLDRAAALIPAIVAAADRSGIRPDVDLRPEAVIVQVHAQEEGIPAEAVVFAAEVSRAAAALDLVADPTRAQTVQVYVAQHSGADARPFFLAALGYDPLGDGDAVDPLRRGPQLAFNPITGDAPARGRTHFDVFVPADQVRARVDAALAAGGRMADDSYAPSWWSLASPDNHGVDIAAWPDTRD